MTQFFWSYTSAIDHDFVYSEVPEPDYSAMRLERAPIDGGTPSYLGPMPQFAHVFQGQGEAFLIEAVAGTGVSRVVRLGTPDEVLLEIADPAEGQYLHYLGSGPSGVYFATGAIPAPQPPDSPAPAPASFAVLVLPAGEAELAPLPGAEQAFAFTASGSDVFVKRATPGGPHEIVRITSSGEEVVVEASNDLTDATTIAASNEAVCWTAPGVFCRRLAPGASTHPVSGPADFQWGYLFVDEVTYWPRLRPENGSYRDLVGAALPE